MVSIPFINLRFHLRQYVIQLRNCIRRSRFGYLIRSTLLPLEFH